MRAMMITLASALALATFAHAGQPELALDDYLAYDADQRQAHVMGLWDGLMVAETYHKTQELAWLSDCGAHGVDVDAMTEAFDSYLDDRPDAAAFSTGHAFVYAMARHCDNAPQFLKDLAR